MASAVSAGCQLTCGLLAMVTLSSILLAEPLAVGRLEVGWRGAGLGEGRCQKLGVLDVNP